MSPPTAPAELESYLEQLPGARILLDMRYRILAANRAYRAAYSGGEDVVGRHCFEVSHGYSRPCDESGESCPRRNALASGHMEKALHVHRTPRGDEHVLAELTPVRNRAGRISLFVESMESVGAAQFAAATDALVGRTKRFGHMLELVSRAAPTDTPVLLLGETGTGKELLARRVHESSARAKAPFVAVDCSGLTETLFESELFGHEKGSFTGAIVRKAGLVEAAMGGTLFLDEVGDIPLGLQVKLLRLLETGSFRRVGGVEPLHADFRLIAATHRDLGRMVREERFRSDLFYRISAFPVELPPLRERRDDIPLLARSLLARLFGNGAPNLAPETLRLLQAYDFPGNVRELRNILQRARLLADGNTIEPNHLPDELRAARHEHGVMPDDPLWSAEAQAIEAALVAHGGNRRQLAAALGISERTLYRKLSRIERSPRRPR